MKHGFFRTAAAVTAAVFLCLPARAENFSGSVSARSAILVDAQTGRVLYEKNADEQSLIASTTKIMTGLLVCEAGELEREISVPPEAAGVEGSSLYLKAGERITVRELLYGLMLRSGNDAAVALAIATAGSMEAFVGRMNEKAQALGLTNTHFENPNGLDGEVHYSTARDLAKLSVCAMQNETFRAVVSSKSFTENGRSFTNHNKLLWRVDGADGIKTGYTSQAGRCVISEATGDGLDLLGIVCGAATTVLDSGDLLMENFTECARLFDYGFDNYSYLPIMSPLYPVDQVKINNSAGAEAVAVAPQDEIKVLLPNDYDPDKLVTDIQLNSDSVDAPVREGDVLGSATVTYAGEILGQTKLLAITDVARSEISSAAAGTGAYIQKNWWKWVVIAIFAAIGVILVLIVLYQLRKRRYRRKRMEQRRRALENQRRRFREGYDLPVDELEQR